MYFLFGLHWSKKLKYMVSNMGVTFRKIKTGKIFNMYTIPISNILFIIGKYIQFRVELCNSLDYLVIKMYRVLSLFFSLCFCSLLDGCITHLLYKMFKFLKRLASCFLEIVCDSSKLTFWIKMTFKMNIYYVVYGNTWNSLY